VWTKSDRAKKMNISHNSSIQLKDNIRLHCCCHSLDSWTISSFSIYIMYIIILFHCVHIPHNLHDIYMWIQNGSVLQLHKNETPFNLHYRTEIDALKHYSLSKPYNNSENTIERKKTSFCTNLVLREILKNSLGIKKNALLHTALRWLMKRIFSFCFKMAVQEHLH